MQEEVENRTLTLVVNGTKFTGRLFKAAICKYLAHRKEKKLNKQRSRDAPVKPRVSRRSSSSLVRTRAFPISRSPIPPSRSLRRSPGNTVWIMR